jgi:hypothetical protein
VDEPDLEGGQCRDGHCASSANLLDLPLARRLTSPQCLRSFWIIQTHHEQPCKIEDVKNLIEALKAAVDTNTVSTNR